nr:unnamed protein product [Naegleria fowleri]
MSLRSSHPHSTQPFIVSSQLMLPTHVTLLLLQFLLFCSLCCQILLSSSSLITVINASSVKYRLKTVAGVAQSQGYNSDNILATTSKLALPHGVAVDTSSHEDLYIVDSSNFRVRKVSNGIISTIVGDGNAGFSGENVMATNAKINRALGLAWNDGLLYLADTNNHRIRVVTAAGMIRTLAGTGVQGYNGELTAPLNTQMTFPVGVFVQGDDIYYSENGRIRKIVNGANASNSNNVYVMTLVGNGTNGYDGDYMPATSAQVNAPHGIFVTSSGEVLFADRLNHRIRKITIDGMIVTIAGTGSTSYNGNGLLATSTNLNSPEGVFELDNNEILVADSGNHCIRKITTDGLMQTIAGICGSNVGYNGDMSDSMNGFLNLPTSITFSKNSGIYISETNNQIIRQLVPYCDSGYVLSADLQSCVNNVTCFGFSSNSGFVCSSNGICNVTDSCSCRSGWYGQTCAYNYQCSGIAPDNATVCNRRGRCTAWNSCTCYSGYSGLNCENVSSSSSSSSSSLAVSIGVVVAVVAICCVVTCVCGTSVCIICRNKRKRRHRKYDRSKTKFTEKEPKILQSAEPTINTNFREHNEYSIDANHVVVTVNSTTSGITPSSPSTTTSSYLPLHSGSYTPSTTIESYSLYVPSESYNSQSTSNSLTVMASNHGYDKFTSKDHTYRVVKLLGKGGFGSCYLCENIQTLEQIAVKVVQATDENYASICSEFSKCLAFQHPRLVKSIEYLAGLDRNSICLAMKYYRYGDLEHVVKNIMHARPPSDALLVSLINQIGEGLQYLHDVQGVIHRDIKPKNIMVDEFDELNNSIQVVIGDFGVSKQANAAHTYAGTFYYVSPEIYLGKTCTFATDIFSLGVMLYAVITGEMDCEQVSITQRLLDIGERAYAEIENKLNEAQVHQEIVNLVMKMLARDPEQRPLAKELVVFNVFQSV